MENKYYTPTIEEFHVGFEFESNYVGFSSDLKWKKILLNNSHDWFWTAYKQDAVETEFRVKYLDKEDIESLGFTQITYDCYNLPIGDEELRLLFENDIFKIFLADKYSDMLFQGTIKNKSELKRVLKMLNKPKEDE